MSDFTIPIRREDYLDAEKKKPWREMDPRCNQKARFLDKDGKRKGNVSGSVLRSTERQVERTEPPEVSFT